MKPAEKPYSYSDYVMRFKKIMKTQDKPAKEKHIRAIVMATSQERSGMNFFLAFNDFHQSSHYYIRWKCLLILHLVWKVNVHDRNVLVLVQKSINEMSLLKFTELVYSKIIESYTGLLSERMQFLMKFNFIKNDLKLADNKLVMPFNSLPANMQYILSLMEHFKVYFDFCIEVINSVERYGVNPYAIPENQNKVRPLIPVLEDMNAIYSLVARFFQNLSLPENRLEDFDTICQKFTKLYDVYRNLLKKLSVNHYITTMYIIPSLLDDVHLKVVKTLEREQRKQAPASSAVTVSKKKPPPRPTNGDNSVVHNPFTGEKSVGKESTSSTRHIPISPNVTMSNSLDNVSNTTHKLTPSSKAQSDMNILEQVFSSTPNEITPQRMSSKCSVEIEPINVKSQVKIDELSAMVQNLTAEVKEKENLIQEMTKAQGIMESQTGKVADAKMIELIKINAELSKKLEAEKVKSTERDELKRKFDTLTTMYGNLRKEYKNIEQGIQKNQSIDSASNEQSKEDIVNALISSHNNDIRRLREIINQRDKSISELQQNVKRVESEKSDLAASVGNGTGLKDDDLKSSVRNVCTVAHNLDLAKGEDMKISIKNALLSCLSETITNLNNFDSNIATDGQKNLSILVQMMKIHENVGRIYMLGQLLGEKAEDGELDTYLSQMLSEYNTAVEKLNNSDLSSVDATFVETLSNLMQIVFMFVQGIEEINQKTETINFDAEINKCIKAVDCSLENIQDLTLNIKNNKELENVAGKYKPLLSDCSEVFEMVKKFINDCNPLHREILTTKNTENRGEKTYYKKNLKLIEGIASLAKAVGVNAEVASFNLKELCNNHCSIEEFIVSLSNIYPSICQVVSNAQVKADKHSRNLIPVVDDARNVRLLVNKAVKTARSIMDTTTGADIDVKTISKARAAAIETETQISIIELEVKLERQREKLGKIRQAEYK